jgi:hypothetical protein
MKISFIPRRKPGTTQPSTKCEGSVVTSFSMKYPSFTACSVTASWLWPSVKQRETNECIHNVGQYINTLDAHIGQKVSETYFFVACMNNMCAANVQLYSVVEIVSTSEMLICYPLWTMPLITFGAPFQCWIWENLITTSHSMVNRFVSISSHRHTLIKHAFFFTMWKEAHILQFRQQ